MKTLSSRTRALKTKKKTEVDLHVYWLIYGPCIDNVTGVGTLPIEARVAKSGIRVVHIFSPWIVINGRVDLP